MWTHFTDAALGFRPEPRACTPLEHMVHQSAPVICRYGTVEGLPAAPHGRAVPSPSLPGPGQAAPTERPG